MYSKALYDLAQNLGTKLAEGTDPGFLTLLQDDEIIGGLEIVSKSSGELEPLHPMPGSLVINTYVGGVAKVTLNSGFSAAPRISIVLFVLAPKDLKVEAPEEFVHSEHPRLYLPFDFDEYRKLRAGPPPVRQLVKLSSHSVPPPPENHDNNCLERFNEKIYVTTRGGPRIFRWGGLN
ncbi:hypothetical protein LguiA_035398 [Lonicera macranthoides]